MGTMMNTAIQGACTSSGIQRFGAALALSLFAASSCRPEDPRSIQRLDSLEPVALSDGLVYVHPARSRAVRLQLSSDPAAAPRVTRFSVGPQAVRAVRRPGAEEVLVLCRGERGAPGVAPVAATLVALPATASAQPRVYNVGSPFNAISVTSDGRFAVVHYAPDRTLDRLLFNPNEVAVVDLAAEPSETNPRRRTVRSFGGIPTSVQFSPPFTIRGESRTIAVVVSSSYVTLIDLAHLDRAETSVRLTLAQDAREIVPQQLLFDAEARAFYLRATGSNDVYFVRLDDSGTPPAEGNDFRASINQIGAGRDPSDLALFGAGDARRLLVVSSGSSEVRVIDPRSNAITSLALDARADRVLLFEGPSPRDPNTTLRALVYPSNNVLSARAVSFIDLGAIESRGSQNLETVQVGRTIRRALALPGRGTMLFEHEDVTSAGRLSLLDLGRRTTAPILAEVSLAEARFNTDARLLWVAPNGNTRVGFVQLDNFHPGEVRLDAPVREVIALPAMAGAPSRALAVHEATGGSVTVLDGNEPRRETARRINGFLLADLLEQGAP